MLLAKRHRPWQFQVTDVYGRHSLDSLADCARRNSGAPGSARLLSSRKRNAQAANPVSGCRIGAQPAASFTGKFLTK
jgi:hypothetical protein